MGKKIKVAIIIRGFHSGGIEKVFETYLSHMKRSGFDFHIITHMKNDPNRKKIFLDLGCAVHEFSKLHGHRLTLRNILEYKDLFEKYSFDVVHNNMPDNLLPLWFAKMKGVPCRILHAHNVYVTEDEKNFFIRNLYRKGFALNSAKATVLIGVSEDAALSVFGKKNMEKVIILPNAIEVEKYKYRADIRDEMREILTLKNKFVIGHIGRYENNQKNQEFVLAILKKLLKIMPESRLLMVGDGKRQKELKKMAIDMNIEDKVIFTGNVMNVQDYLQAMDFFVLPSRKEGLGIAAVEAQAAGLYCLVSDRVPDEVKATNNIEFLSIDCGVDLWVSKISKKKNCNRSSGYKKMKGGRYDIEAQSSKLGDIYYGYSKHSY